MVGGPVRGFSGGGVLLRREMLVEIGLFDPRFFAYYEDTDLAWRARRGGWSTVAVPESVIHHAYGASGGHRAKGFFFLDRRNWMLTAFRNGDQELAHRVRNTAQASPQGNRPHRERLRPSFASLALASTSTTMA